MHQNALRKLWITKNEHIQVLLLVIVFRITKLLVWHYLILIKYSFRIDYIL